MERVGSVLDVVERINAAGTISKATVERATGAALGESDDSNASFTFYRAEHVRVGDHMLAVNLRAPVAGSGATSGSLLTLDVAGPCIERDAVEARFGPATLSQAPRGRSPDERTYWARREGWGELAFGFAGSGRPCLAAIVFTGAQAGAR